MATTISGNFSMKRLVAAAALAFSLIAQPALAGDIDWNGWYAGFNLGGGNSGDASYTGDHPTGPIPGAGTFFTSGLAFQSGQISFDPVAAGSVNQPSYLQSLSGSGVLAGAQLGYSRQLNDKWVGGFEADLQHAGIDSEGQWAYPDPASAIGVTLATEASRHLDWYGTLRGRLGYLVNDRLLAYGTAGVVYGQSSAAGSIAINGATGWNVSSPSMATAIICNGFTTCLAGASSGLSLGLAVGGGVEFALTPKLSLKAEFVHLDLPQTVRLDVQSPATGDGFVNVKFAGYNTVRAGLNFRF